jgi:hypothetical protein
MISSTCCGQEEHGDVPGMCRRCLDWAGFETTCDECDSVIIDAYDEHVQGHYYFNEQDLCLKCFSKVTLVDIPA